MWYALFWLSLILLVYIYAGYPALVRLAASLAPEPVRARDGDTPGYPC